VTGPKTVGGPVVGLSRSHPHTCIFYQYFFEPEVVSIASKATRGIWVLGLSRSSG
jgi:hypothetical protein